MLGLIILASKGARIRPGFFARGTALAHRDRITAAMMVVEIAAGMMSHSIALLADGWHMSTHVLAFLITAAAYYFARTQAGNARFSFGTGKIGDLTRLHQRGRARDCGVPDRRRISAPAPCSTGNTLQPSDRNRLPRLVRRIGLRSPAGRSPPRTRQRQRHDDD